MEEKKLSEQESLELISQMIRSTRKNMEVGSGNQFLYWGYFTAALSVLLFLLVYYTGDARWSIGWFSMFLFWGFMLRMQRKETPSVITYSFYWCTIRAMPAGASAGSVCFCSGALCFVCSARKLLR